MANEGRILGEHKIGPYMFRQIHDAWYARGETVWKFEIDGAKPNHECYRTLDRALVAAVGERHTGRRDAGGTAVGTAADWFMKMIGADGLGD